MRTSLLLLFSLFFTANVWGQQSRLPAGGGEYTQGKAECVTATQRAAIKAMLDANRQMLISQGKLRPASAEKKTTGTMFNWPLHQVSGSYFSYYGISNYIDHDSTYPDHLQDYTCGTRTYDLASGYNHAGTDIFLWPFDWNMMEAEQVEIIAAAPGTIIGKSDGNPDHDCGLEDTTNWNAVYIQHDDGTVAWYGHMKKGTPTTKDVGETVALGEHLGYVGSSGSSTGPHLHFEVHDASDKVRDPWNGTCNTLPSMWNEQKPYHDPHVNAVMTHNAPPGFAPCPETDTINACDTFLPGDHVLLASYYHDQQSTDTSIFTVKEPDGTTFDSWEFHPTTAYYEASYWYWTETLPLDAVGTWSFSVKFHDSTYTHHFYVTWPAGVNRVTPMKMAYTVFPVPAKGVFYINGNVPADEAELLNVLGQNVWTQYYISGKVDAHNLAAGVYYLRLTADGTTEVHRIVLQ